VPNIGVVIATRLASPPPHSAPADGTFCWRTFRWTVARAACSEQVALLGLLWMSMILQTDALGTTLSVLVGGAMFFSALHHAAHILLFEHDFSSGLRRFAARAIAAATAAATATLSRTSLSSAVPHRQTTFGNSHDIRLDNTALDYEGDEGNETKSLQRSARKHRGDFPSTNANVIWFGFVGIVLVLFNVVFATFVTLRYIAVPTLNSLPVAILVYSVAALFAFLLIEVYEKTTIVRNAFKPAVY
jgi:hypothetical protein